ncbi:MAG: glycosyl transferase [Gemmatimonadetes bacterium]|nr:glycosyl transferase [Gemmatimonadota bacterium]
MTFGLVSIVLPTYNRAYCLGQTLSSVLEQSYRQMEVLIIDDGSTDGTGELIEREFGHDPRIRYAWFQNAGLSAARNRGIAIALGEYIAFCDSDDIWHREKIAIEAACMRADERIGLVWTDVVAVDINYKTLHPRYTRVAYPAWQMTPMEQLFQKTITLHLDSDGTDVTAYVGDLFGPMIIGSYINMPTVMVRRLLLDRAGGFDETMRAGEDYDWCIRMCLEAPAAFVDVPMADYRIGAPDQITRPALMVDQARNSLRTMLPLITAHRDRIDLSPSMLRRVLAGRYRWLGEAELDAGHRGRSWRALLKSIYYQPSHARTLGLLCLALLPAPFAETMVSVYRGAKRGLR